MTDWLTEYLDYASDSETPMKMLYWVGVSAVAGALRRNVWIDQGRYQLYPNFFIVLVARPGVVQKTTTINYGLKLLRKLPAIKFAPKNVTWEGFIALLENLHSASHGELSLDSTITRTAAITVVSGEFSLFYDPEDDGMISALTDIWDCPEDFDKGTKFSGSEFIDNPCVNLIGATTPAFMARGFDKFSKEGGLASRIIFVHATTKRQRIAHPKAQPKQAQDKLVERLERISQMHGVITITPEAYTRSEAWYEAHCDEVERGGILQSTGFQDRKQAHVLKLAIILSCVKRGDYRITVEDFDEAVAKIDEVEGDFIAAFEALDDRDEIRPYRELKACIMTNGQMSRSALLGRFTTKYLLQELDRALLALIHDGSVSLGAGPSGPYYKWKGSSE